LAQCGLRDGKQACGPFCVDQAKEIRSGGRPAGAPDDPVCGGGCLGL